MKRYFCGTSSLWRKPRQAEALTPADFTSFNSMYENIEFIYNYFVFEVNNMDSHDDRSKQTLVTTTVSAVLAAPQCRLLGGKSWTKIT